MIALDASVLLAADDADDQHHDDVTRLIESGGRLATLDLAVYEAVNVAIRRWQDIDAAFRLRERIFAIERFGVLVRVDGSLAATAESLASEHGISAYDAGYVAAARHLQAPLASCDYRDLVGKGLAQAPGALL